MKGKEIKHKALTVLLLLVIVAIVIIIAWGIFNRKSAKNDSYDDGVEQIDLNTIYLSDSGVEVSFSDVILSNHNETRKLIVSTQEATVSTELTDQIIKQLDFDFLKKTQMVDYTGTGYFVVDLDKIREDGILVDEEKKVITIKIDHAYLQAIDINPENIIIDEVQEGLLARGDIELSMKDVNSIEKELRSRLEEKFDTVENGQTADGIALKMVKEVYEPVIKAVDKQYSVEVEFK